MNLTPDHQEALLQLLEDVRLSQDEVSERLRQALNPVYWKALNPSLSIERDQPGNSVETNSIGSLARAELHEEFGRKGYFQIDSLLCDSTVERLKAGIESVRAAGWPGVFSFVYDQFWTASRTPAIASLLTAILGPDYKQNSHVWTHYVQPQRGATGWPAHLDNYGRPDRVAVWIALSDATLDNGCMYLIPKDVVPQRLVDSFAAAEPYSLKDLQIMLQGAQALPVRRGSVLGWQHEMIHWGSRRRAEQTDPRISISLEFASAATTPREDELPLLETSGSLPTFEQRIYAIGKGILEYQRIETLLIRYLDLAEGLVAATSTAATGDSAR